MLRVALLLIAAFALSACDREKPADPVERDHAQEKHLSHEAVYGGALIELGAHAAQAELVFDKETGTVTVYLWDSCVSKPARSKQLGIRVEFGEELSIDLDPVANPLTGETFGDTSKFEAQSDALKGAEPGKGILGAIEILGTRFEPTPFDLK